MNQILKPLSLALLLMLLSACVFISRPEESPWCTLPLETPEGRLYPNGTLEREGEQKQRCYLPIAREDKQVGLALARYPDGTIKVCDIILWGPADRAGFRPGQVVAEEVADMNTLLERLAKKGGPVKIKDQGKTRSLTVKPVDDIRGHSQATIPLLIHLSGNCSQLDFALPLGLAGINWRRVEAEAGKPVHRIDFTFLFGLITI